MAEDILLRMTDITKNFPGVKALDQVSLELEAGTILKRRATMSLSEFCTILGI